MVEVKEKIKVKPGTVVKIELDDKGDIRVTTGDTPWVYLDEEDDCEENYATSSSAVTIDEDDYVEPQPCDFPVYRPTEIEYKGKKYFLKAPLDCVVLRGRGSESYCIEYDPLDVWGAGRTWEEAVDFFNFQFTSTYDSLNEDGEERLANHYHPILKLINSMVIKVE
jgi:hypothetical protein